MNEQQNIEHDFSDIVTEIPHEFTVGRKHFRLYPVTLAKTFVLSRLFPKLNINNSMLMANPYMEALRVAEASREACCQVLAVHTAPNTYKDLFNSQNTAMRRNALMKLSTKSLATLLFYVLTSDKTEAVIRDTGIGNERERMKKVMAIKGESKNNVTFGGKTILGAFIAQLMEMGFTYVEILYERSYSFLRLMLADKVVSMYLTDDEVKKLPSDLSATALDGNDPASFEKLRTKLANKGVKFE